MSLGKHLSLTTSCIKLQLPRHNFQENNSLIVIVIFDLYYYLKHIRYNTRTFNQHNITQNTTHKQKLQKLNKIS